MLLKLISNERTGHNLPDYQIVEKEWAQKGANLKNLKYSTKETISCKQVMNETRYEWERAGSACSVA